MIRYLNQQNVKIFTDWPQYCCRFQKRRSYVMSWGRLPDRRVCPWGREAPGAGDRGGESRQRLVAPPPPQYRQPGQGQDIAGDSLPRGPSDFFVDCSANASPSFIVTTSSWWGIRGHHVESGQDAWHPGIPESRRLLGYTSADLRSDYHDKMLTLYFSLFLQIWRQSTAENLLADLEGTKYDIGLMLLSAHIGAGLQYLKPKEEPRCLETREGWADQVCVREDATDWLDQFQRLLQHCQYAGVIRQLELSQVQDHVQQAILEGGKVGEKRNVQFTVTVHW